MPWAPSCVEDLARFVALGGNRDPLEVARSLGRRRRLEIGDDEDARGEQRIDARERRRHVLRERRLVGRTLELDAHRAGSTRRRGQIGRRPANVERPENVGADVGDDPGGRVARGRGGARSS